MVEANRLRCPQNKAREHLSPAHLPPYQGWSALTGFRNTTQTP